MEQIHEFKTNNNNVTPSVVERRLTLQLLAYWERLRAVRIMPTENDINPDELNDLWDDCFLIHAHDIGQQDYNFVYLGDHIKKAFTGTVDDDAALFSESLNVSRLTPSINKVLSTLSPVVEEGEVLNDMNQLVRYRQCLLPLGEGNKVLAVFGGMRCKVYPHERAIQ